MDPLFAVAFVASASALSAGTWWWSRRSLRSFVLRHCLSRREELRRTLLSGEIRGQAIRVEIARPGAADEQVTTRIQLDVSDRLDVSWVFGVNLGAEKIWTEIGGEKIVIAAERSAALPGDPVARIEGGFATLSMSGAAAQAIEDRLLQLMQVVDLLAAESRTDALLAQVAYGESISGRERALVRLLAHHPDSEASKTALSLCSESEEAQLRLMAAKHLPEQRRALIDALLEAEDTPDTILAEALFLADDLPPKRVRAVALRILDGPPSRARSAAIRLFADLSDEEVPDRLLEIAAHVSDASTAVELADAFATLGGPKSVRGLERLLRFSHPEVQRRALAALGRSGDRETLGVLHHLANLLDRTGLGDEAAAANAAIRERLGAPEGGRLSVVPTAPQGGLSSPPGGGLSYSED